MSEIDDLESLFLNDIPLIDTRAPVEFNKGSLPLASNLPLIIDEEREAVGICYGLGTNSSTASLKRNV